MRRSAATRRRTASPGHGRLPRGRRHEEHDLRPGDAQERDSVASVGEAHLPSSRTRVLHLLLHGQRASRAPTVRIVRRGKPVLHAVPAHAREARDERYAARHHAADFVPPLPRFARRATPPRRLRCAAQGSDCPRARALAAAERIVSGLLLRRMPHAEAATGGVQRGRDGAAPPCSRGAHQGRTVGHVEC